MSEDTSLADYKATDYEKGTYLGKAKTGKTVFLASSMLGLQPIQRKNKSGGIVSRPSNLHIICIDQSAASGILNFLVKVLGADAEAVSKIRTYNMQNDVQKLGQSQSPYNMSFYNAFVNKVERIKERVSANPGVHAVICSSLTGMARAVERGVAGPPGSAGKIDRKTGQMLGSGYMDPSKWQALSHQMSTLRSQLQVDDWHCLWEGHIEEVKSFSMGGGDATNKQKIAIAGETGRNWAFNTDHTYIIERSHDDPWKGTLCDKVHLDTKPELEFMEGGGRGSTENMKAKEFDLTAMYRRLGLKVGGWGRGSSKTPKS